MRDLKFRAWVSCQKRYYGPASLMEMDKTWSYPFSWGEIEQFTGKYDEDGREVYENDIVEVDLCTKRKFVDWHHESACFVLRHLPTEDYSDNYFMDEVSMKVVSNLNEHED